jgi:hypothetical protein
MYVQLTTLSDIKNKEAPTLNSTASTCSSPVCSLSNLGIHCTAGSEHGRWNRLNIHGTSELGITNYVVMKTQAYGARTFCTCSLEFVRNAPTS